RASLPYRPPPAPRNPHSFPTRRSSDLHHLHLARDEIVDRRPATLVVHRLQLDPRGILEQLEGEAARGRGAGRAVVQPRAVRPGVDRKSTRLNSSHDQISYAVFCLKKKT